MFPASVSQQQLNIIYARESIKCQYEKGSVLHCVPLTRRLLRTRDMERNSEIIHIG